MASSPVKGKRSKRQRRASADDDGCVTEEEEDMALCLMLLARGGAEFRSKREYECKTCSKCFPSFQALGGHRTSHKKKQKQPSPAAVLLAIPAAAATPKQQEADTRRVHECSMCGAEFTSGQALGGHMRRHRPLEKEKKSILELDLNMPCQELLFPSLVVVDCHY